jgi:hypothetical protein
MDKSKILDRFFEEQHHKREKGFFQSLLGKSVHFIPGKRLKSFAQNPGEPYSGHSQDASIKHRNLS